MAQKISVKIAGRQFNLTAETPELEEIYRLAAEAISARFSSYSLNHLGKQDYELMTMVALNEAVMRISIQKEKEKSDKEQKALERDLEKYLGKEV